jgi:hypothetical protein
MTRGIRQGCPISALLFLLVVEVMAIEIRTNSLINGFKINNKCIKLTQLADDTTLFLSSKSDIDHSFNTIEKFGKYSGLKLNKNKTEGMWIGKSKHSDEKYGNINWPKEPIKALGIFFSTNEKECYSLNWEKCIEKCSETLKMWKKRNLTIFGRIQVINSLIVPNLLYRLHSLVLNKVTLNILEKMVFNFIWKEKIDKIKRKTMIGPKNKGGLAVIDIVSKYEAMKIKFVSSLNDNLDANWKVIPSFFLEQYGRNFLVFFMTFEKLGDLPSIKHKLPAFYSEVVKIFANFKNLNENSFYGAIGY